MMNSISQKWAKNIFRGKVDFVTNVLNFLLTLAYVGNRRESSVDCILVYIWQLKYNTDTLRVAILTIMFRCFCKWKMSFSFLPYAIWITMILGIEMRLRNVFEHFSIKYSCEYFKPDVNGMTYLWWPLLHIHLVLEFGTFSWWILVSKHLTDTVIHTL